MREKIVLKTVGFSPLIVALGAFLFLMAAPSTSMELWQSRAYASNVITLCLVTHIIVMVWFFLKRKWKEATVALLCLPMLFLVAFIGAMLVGPDIGSIKDEVAAAVARPVEELKCLGGNLSRESIVLFECRQKLDVSGGNVCQVGEDESIYERISEIAIGFNVPLQRRYDAWRIRLDCDTILIVDDGVCQVVIFMGRVCL